jgi:hypothetical protein
VIILLLDYVIDGQIVICMVGVGLKLFRNYLEGILIYHLVFIMPAITRSKTRQLINKINSTDPYYSDYLKTVRRSGSASNIATLESLLKREQTPDIEELVRTVIDLHEESELKRRQDHALHVLGDIIFEALAPVRSYLSKCPDPSDSTNVLKFNISEFILAWKDSEVHVDTNMTREAIILKKFITDKCPGKAKDPKYMQAKYDRYKAWLTIYDECSNLVHGGLDQMEPQIMWDALKDICNQIISGEAALTNPKLIQFALEAVDEVQTHKFENHKGVIRLRNGPEIVP